jgi:hypothetical protein
VLAEQAAPALRAHGYLVVGGIGRPGVDHISTTVAEVAHAGFGFFQHVVAAAMSDRTGHVDVLVFRRPE